MGLFLLLWMGVNDWRSRLIHPPPFSSSGQSNVYGASKQPVKIVSDTPRCFLFTGKFVSKHRRVRVPFSQPVCLWESRDKTQRPVYLLCKYETHTHTHTPQQCPAVPRIGGPCCSGPAFELLFCLSPVFSTGQCSRHHHGRWAGVCHPAQHHRQTAVWPGNSWYQFSIRAWCRRIEKYVCCWRIKMIRIERSSADQWSWCIESDWPHYRPSKALSIR